MYHAFSCYKCLLIQYPKAISTLITKNILHQLNQEKKCDLVFGGDKFSLKTEEQQASG